MRLLEASDVAPRSFRPCGRSRHALSRADVLTHRSSPKQAPDVLGHAHRRKAGLDALFSSDHTKQESCPVACDQWYTLRCMPSTSAAWVCERRQEGVDLRRTAATSRSRRHKSSSRELQRSPQRRYCAECAKIASHDRLHRHCQVISDLGEGPSCHERGNDHT